MRPPESQEYRLDWEIRRQGTLSFGISAQLSQQGCAHKPLGVMFDSKETSLSSSIEGRGLLLSLLLQLPFYTWKEKDLKLLDEVGQKWVREGGIFPRKADCNLEGLEVA